MRERCRQDGVDRVVDSIGIDPDLGSPQEYGRRLPVGRALGVAALAALVAVGAVASFSSHEQSKNTHQPDALACAVSNEPIDVTPPTAAAMRTMKAELHYMLYKNYNDLPTEYRPAKETVGANVGFMMSKAQPFFARRSPQDGDWWMVCTKIHQRDGYNRPSYTIGEAP